MRLENFQLNKIQFKWGDMISDIKSQVDEKDIILKNELPYPKNKTLKIQLPEIWYIKTNSCEFSSPDSDRLINNISISIKANDNNQEHIIQSLESHLGPKSTDYVGENYGSGSVVKNCTWKFDNCIIGVSIYGGIRNENNEASIGQLYFNMQDIQILDLLYTSHLKESESDLANKVDIESIECYQMEKKQHFFWAMQSEKFPNYSSDFISRALNGFHKKAMFLTPKNVREVLSKFDISIWKTTTGIYYLSNYWESIELSDSLKTSWINMLPAKGEGNCSISIGDIRINNKHSRPNTSALIAHIEKILNTAIECQQVHDC